MFRFWHRCLFLLTALLVAVALAATFHSARLADEGLSSMMRSEEVMTRFLRLRALLGEAESTARGYMLAGDTVSLALMGQARAEALVELRRLQEMTRGNMAQQELLRRLQELAEGRFAAFDLMVARHGGALDQPAYGPLVDESRGLARALQARTDEGIAREELLFRQGVARIQKHLARLHFTALASGLLGFATAVAGLALMKRAQQASLRAAVLEIDKSRAENLARRKSHFLACMSEEIREPLAVMLGQLEAVVRKGGAVRGEMKAAHGSGLALMRLVDDLRDLSRLEAGHQALSLDAVSVRELFRDLEASVLPEVEDKGLTFICRVSPDVPPLLELDAAAVKQALTSLLENAVRFTREGSIALEALGTRLPGGTPRFDLQFRVSDTGIGIPVAQQAALLDDYGSPGTTDMASGRGTGLGLKITRRLVRLMGGGMTLRSGDGDGTCFTLKLPSVAVVPAPAWADDRSVGAASGCGMATA